MFLEKQKKGPPGKQKDMRVQIYRFRWFYVMFLPVMISFFIFNYIPMTGICYSFTEYTPFHEPVFVGLENFRVLFASPAFWSAFRNTLEISLVNLVLPGVQRGAGFADR